jgi:hypothetical protein
MPRPRAAAAWAAEYGRCSDELTLIVGPVPAHRGFPVTLCY